ncbi:MAG: NUDIX domain-containing protein [Micromonosporaceae bacterium]
MESVVKRSARAIVIDDQGYLVLIKRTKPGTAPYWTAPGGGVEPDDPSVEAALVRELREELGAEVDSAQQVFLVSNPAGAGIGVQHFFVCHLRKVDLAQRSGPEFDDPARGGYDLDRVTLTNDDLGQVDLKPAELRTFVMANRVALLDAAGFRKG